MISGDHHETAVYVAKRAGIVFEDDASEEGVCMTGEAFRAAIGGYTVTYDPVAKIKKVEFDDLDAFKDVNASLRVISRATPEDKLLLVSGIKESRGIVSMTGDSVSDVDALKTASVGICMGDGCQVAKESSDLVILDNDFVSIHRSIKWGRTLFDNVRKFLQFQLTINLTVCLLVLISCATLGRSPLNVIQLLWTNLIMDVLAAIALGTEPKSKEMVQTEASRVSKKTRLIEPYMWRYIVGQSAYQVTILLIFSYFGVFIFFEEEDRFNIISTNTVDDELQPTNRLVLDTIVFHSFILMNLANMICCKVGGIREPKALFTTLLSNVWFWAVFGCELFIQLRMIDLPNGGTLKHLVGTSELTFGQSVTCYTVAFLSIPLNSILHNYVDLGLFAFMNKIQLEKKGGSNTLTDLVDKTQTAVKRTSIAVNRRLSQVDDYQAVEDEDDI